MTIRIGHGFDVHAFCDGDHIMLGGVKIAHDKAFKAHSDGDVLLHALCDALLGAAALGDIGQHFPDTDAAYSGADSRVLLKSVMAKVSAQGYRVGNIDATVMAQKPKLAPHIVAMRECIAEDLVLNINQVSVKATTTEKLGFVGKEEGVAAHATVLIYKD